MDQERKIKGRGAQHNPTNRFEKSAYSDDESWEDPEEASADTTKYLEVFPKTIVNKVDSPDVGMYYSLNPYQGCEHGCTYCYARPTHEYWGYSPGLDFERTILVKRNAPDLLRRTFDKKGWKVEPIVLSGNTDCYQPAERKYEITRELLKVFLEYRHPVGIITKNVLIQRDMDIIGELARLNLIAVYLSITTLDEFLRRALEPRTATAVRKLALVKTLSSMHVPVTVMASPVIPALNDHEILNIAKKASENGAVGFHSHIVRLMGANEAIFENWLKVHFPDRQQKVMNQLRSMHKGKTGSSDFGARMRGGGNIALNIRRLGELAVNRYFSDKKTQPLRTDLFAKPGNGQLDLFTG